jgi:hypothetical protein
MECMGMVGGEDLAPDRIVVSDADESLGVRIVDAVLIPIVITLVFLAPYSTETFRKILSRPLWLDEIHTALIVDDPNPSHALHALARGADFNPPTLYLLCKAFRAVTGTSGAASLRLVALASVLIALLGINAMMRGLYPRVVALAIVAAVWSHPLLMHAGFDSRFYAPWAAMIVWFCWALVQIDRRPRRPRMAQALAASLAILVCTIHYFGVFSLALVVAAQLLSRRRTIGSAARILAPAAFGPVALLTFVPVYRGQKASLSVPTWIGRPGLSSIQTFFEAVYPFHIASIVILISFLHLMMRPPVPVAEAEADDRRPVGDLHGLASLALFPLILFAFSLLVQPALMGRYAIPVSASFGALAAPLLARSGRACRALALGLYLAAAAFYLFVERQASIRQVDGRREKLEALAKSEDAPVLFRMRRALYECWWDGPAARSSWYLLETGEASDAPGDFEVLEQDVAINLHRLYDMPKVIGSSEMATRDVFYLFDFMPSQVDRILARNPGFTAQLVDEKQRFYRLTKGR